MEDDSPFATYGKAVVPVKHTRTTHVNFCDRCHHVWKAPSAAVECINCKGNGNCARSLVKYDTTVPVA